MLIQELEPQSEADWDQFVNSHPESTCYHSRAWQKVAERAYKIRTRFLVAREDDSSPITGVMPLFQVNGVVRAHFTNGLFGAYAPALANDAATATALVHESQELLEAEGLQYLLLKTLGDEKLPGFHCMDSWVIAKLRLMDDPDRMWDELRDKIRNCVRKAIRHGIEVRVGQEHLQSFYDVLSENMHLKGAPIYGFGFMQEMLKAFGKDAEIITLWHEDKCIAGAFTLMHRKTVFVPFASSRPSSLHMSPNNLLYWEIIRRACGRGMEFLDFGRSLRNSGPLSFKLGWGAETTSQPCYVYSARGEDLVLDPKQKGVSFFVNQWKRLPRPVANALGPMVCRQVAGLL